MQLQGPPGIGILFLMSIVLLGCPTSMGQNYSILPANLSLVSGKSGAFVCGVSPSNASLNFTLHHSQGVSTLLCPQEGPSKPFPGINGKCEVSGQQVLATWTIGYIINNDNGTYAVCQGTHLPAVYGFLTVHEDKGYFGMLIGCVMGGFIGFIIVFGLGYIALKRSERFQRCFRGRTPQDEISTMVEENYK